MSICCDSSYFQYSLINWPSAGRELMSSSRRREVERSVKAARRQIFIKRCWSLDWVERSFLGWHSAGSATSKTNCSRTNWKIYGSGWESGKAFLQDYLGGKKSSFSQHLVLNFGGLPFMFMQSCARQLTNLLCQLFVELGKSHPWGRCIPQTADSLFWTIENWIFGQKLQWTRMFHFVFSTKSISQCKLVKPSLKRWIIGWQSIRPRNSQV